MVKCPFFIVFLSSFVISSDPVLSASQEKFPPEGETDGMEDVSASEDQAKCSKKCSCRQKKLYGYFWTMAIQCHDYLFLCVFEVG